MSSVYQYPLRLPPGLAVLVADLARVHHQSLNNEVVLAVQEWVAKHREQLESIAESAGSTKEEREKMEPVLNQTAEELQASLKAVRRTTEDPQFQAAVRTAQRWLSDPATQRTIREVQGVMEDLKRWGLLPPRPPTS